MTKQRRVWLVIGVVAVVAALVYLAGGRLPSLTGPPDATPSCKIPDSVPVERSSGALASGGVVVDEVGLSTTSFETVDVAAVVRNIDARIAYGTEVSFQLLDGSTSVLEVQPAALTVRIPILLPGQRTGAVSTATASAPVASARATIGSTTWLAVDQLAGLQPVTATYADTQTFEGSGAHVDAYRYRESSTNCRSLLSRGTVARFRDAGGALIGGARGDPDLGLVLPNGTSVLTEPPSSSSCAPGERDTWFTSVSVTPLVGQIDPSRTTVYPYCDLPYAAVSASGATSTTD